MATNSMNIEQINTVLANIINQATGSAALATYRGDALVTVAQTALLNSPDTVYQAINQLMLKTIFSVRKYVRHLKSMRVDTQRYGNAVRKINYIDITPDANASYEIQDGKSTDMYINHFLKVVQTNLYGQVAYEYPLTTPLVQLDTAFRSAEEFGAFWTSMLTHVNNNIEQAHETLSRALIVNGVASVIDENDGSRVVKLLTDYNTETGLALTSQDIYKPENFPTFMAWAASRIARIRRMLTERSQIFHTNITGKVVSRFTDYRDQRMYLYAPLQFDLNMRALSELFNDRYIKLGDNELVSFWQSIESPEEINQTPVYMGTDGAVKTASAAVEKSTVFGVIQDVDFSGMTVVNERQRTTPMNARGEYFNTFYKFNDRYWMDNSENCVVLLLE